MTGARVRAAASPLARVVLGAVLLVAGAVKVTHPDEVALAVRAYQLLPYGAAGVVGRGLPVLEVALGALLLAGLCTRAAAAAAGGLMVAFCVGIVAAWARGLSIDCGCFGGGGTVAADHTHYLAETARDVALAAAAALLVWRPGRFGLDALLFPTPDEPGRSRPEREDPR